MLSGFGGFGSVFARAEAITANNELAFYVERLCVFGSYLTDKEILGDLDVGYKLERRYDGEEFVAISEKRAILVRIRNKQNVEKPSKRVKPAQYRCG